MAAELMVKITGGGIQKIGKLPITAISETGTEIVVEKVGDNVSLTVGNESKAIKTETGYGSSNNGIWVVVID